MKVLLFSRRFPPDVISGSESVAENLWHRFHTRYPDAILAVGFVQSRELVPPDAVAFDLRPPYGRAQAAWKRISLPARLAALTWRERPDVVLSNSIEFPSLGTPTAIIVHDLNFGMPNSDVTHDPYRTLRLLPYRLQGLTQVRLVAVSDQTRLALEGIGIAPNRIVVIPSAVDTDRFVPAALAPAGRHPYRFVCVSRLIPGKGQLTAVRAMRQVPNAHLVIAGAAPDAEYLAALRKEATGLPVEIVPNVADAVAQYHAADAVLFPTEMEEGLGLVALEGMACGRPVIHADDPAVVGATRGLALVFERGNVDNLAATMRRLMSSTDLQLDLAAAGPAHVSRHFSWSAVFERYVDLLQDMSTQGRK